MPNFRLMPFPLSRRQGVCTPIRGMGREERGGSYSVLYKNCEFASRAPTPMAPMAPMAPNCLGDTPHKHTQVSDYYGKLAFHDYHVVCSCHLAKSGL